MFRSGVVMILANLACAVITAGAVATSALTATVFSVVVSNDPGGPMFLPIAAMGAVLAAGAVSGVLFAVTLVVDGLRRLAKARWWTTSLVAVPCVSAAAGCAAWLYGATALLTLASAGAAFAAFGVYWHAYLAAEVVLSRVADTLFPDRASQGQCELRSAETDER